MTVYDGIILTFILIGIIIIIVSFLLGRYESHMIQQEEEKHTTKGDKNIEYDEVVQKILELNEYGEYLKIELDKRQKELTFMYQMLLDKQKELTSLGAQTMSNTSSYNQNNASSNTSSNKSSNTSSNISSNSTSDTSNNTSSNSKNLSGEPLRHSQRVNTYPEPSVKKTQNSNYNKEIIELTMEGYTATEIAKKLNIGKGQVELVRNLYK